MIPSKNVVLFISAFLFHSLFIAQTTNSSIAQYSKSQSLEKGTHWLDLNLGLSYMNSELTRFDDFTILSNDSRRNVGFIIQPKFQIFLEDKFSVGFHIGYAFDKFENEDINFKYNKNNYYAGFQTEYYFVEVKDFFFVSSEIDIGIHYLVNKFESTGLEIEDTTNTYLISGLHLNLNFKINNEWFLYAKFFNLISYTNSKNNFFDYSEGLRINNSLSDFISFPQFGVRKKLF